MGTDKCSRFRQVFRHINMFFIAALSVCWALTQLTHGSVLRLRASCGGTEGESELLLGSYVALHKKDECMLLMLEEESMKRCI